jgi:hypothetical protein
MKKLFVLIFSVLTVCGCASQRLADAEKNAIIDDYISTEVLQSQSTVSAFRLDSWAALSEQFIILRSSPSRPYLVKLRQACNDLNYSQTLLVTSQLANSLNTVIDYVYTPEYPAFRCRISHIYPLTTAQYRTLIQAVSPRRPAVTDEPGSLTDDKSEITPSAAAS